jgi:hypothetical protein
MKRFNLAHVIQDPWYDARKGGATETASGVRSCIRKYLKFLKVKSWIYAFYTAALMQKMRLIFTAGETSPILVVIVFVKVFVAPILIVIIEGEFIVIIFVVNQCKIEFHRIEGNHFEFDTAFGANKDFTNILEVFVDNGFAFRAIAHSEPPVKTYRKTATDNY